jgi:hypothetical protein
VKSVAFKLDYDPELVTVEDAELGAGVPDTARITLRTVTTEDGAQATITVTSDEPIPAGTVSLASLSVSPRRSGAHLGGLSRLGADPAPETIDRDEDTADIGMPVKIAMPIPAIEGVHANGLQRTHRWTFDHTCHDTAGRLPQVRIPLL